MLKIQDEGCNAEPAKCIMHWRWCSINHFQQGNKWIKWAKVNTTSLFLYSKENVSTYSVELEDLSWYYVHTILNLYCKIMTITKKLCNINTNSLVYCFFLKPTELAMVKIQICWFKFKAECNQSRHNDTKWKLTHLCCSMSWHPLQLHTFLISVRSFTRTLSRPDLQLSLLSIVSMGSAPPGLVKPGHITSAPADRKEIAPLSTVKEVN